MMTHNEMTKIMDDARARGIQINLTKTYLMPIVCGEGQWRLETNKGFCEYIRGGQPEVDAAFERLCQHLVTFLN